MTVEKIQDSPVEELAGQAIDKIAPDMPEEDGQASELEETSEEEVKTETPVAQEQQDEFLAKARPEDIKDPVAKKLYDELVKDYTKKMMEIGDVKTNAQAFEALKNNPEFIEWVRQKKEQAEAKVKEEAQPEVIDLSQMSEEERATYYRNKFKEEIKKEVMSEVKKTITPINETLEKNNMDALNAQMKTITDTFFAKYPEADKFRTPLADLVRKGHSLEEAWEFVQFKQSPQKAVNQARVELTAKKEANLLTVTDKSSPAKQTDKKYNSTEEAARETMADMGL